MSSSFEIPITQAQNNISIADISSFALYLIVRILSIRTNKEFGLKTLRTDGVILFCIVRIVGGALYLSAKNPTDSVLIGALVLESLGSTFLIGELTRLLVAFLDMRAMDFERSHHLLRRFIQCLRIPVFIAIILIIVGYNVDDLKYYRPLGKASSLIIMVTFLVVAGIFAYMAVGLRRVLDMGMASFVLAALSLPFLFVRVLYSVLGISKVDGVRFIIFWGDWKVFVGMSLIMEVMVIACLIASGLYYPSDLPEADAAMGLESRENKSIDA